MDLSNIHKRIQSVENFKNEKKIASQALKDELENNPEYLEACEEVKTATEKRKKIKDEILGKTETQKLIADIKETKEEIDTLEEILSAELIEYTQKNETDEIDDIDGEPRQIKIIAKVLPKKNKYIDEQDRDDEGKFLAKQDPVEASSNEEMAKVEPKLKEEK